MFANGHRECYPFAMNPAKKVVITQSNYLPWKGYFDSIAIADDFVLLDTVQFTKRDWRNRNIIKTAHGLQWLSVPVQVKGKFFQPINETMVADEDWREHHWKTIRHNYSKAPFFRDYEAKFAEFYLGSDRKQSLSQINFELIKIICEILGIKTRIHHSSDFPDPGDKNFRLIEICNHLGATDYFSGPTSRGYLDVELFAQNNIKAHFFEYSGYPTYPQLHGDFVHEVSVIDLIFNAGPAAPDLMKFVNPQRKPLEKIDAVNLCK